MKIATPTRNMSIVFILLSLSQWGFAKPLPGHKVKMREYFYCAHVHCDSVRSPGTSLDEYIKKFGSNPTLTILEGPDESGFVNVTIDLDETGETFRVSAKMIEERPAPLAAGDSVCLANDSKLENQYKQMDEYKAGECFAITQISKTNKTFLNIKNASNQEYQSEARNFYLDQDRTENNQQTPIDSSLLQKIDELKYYWRKDFIKQYKCDVTVRGEVKTMKYTPTLNINDFTVRIQKNLIGFDDYIVVDEVSPKGVDFSVIRTDFATHIKTANILPDPFSSKKKFLASAHAELADHITASIADSVFGVGVQIECSKKPLD